MRVPSGNESGAWQSFWEPLFFPITKALMGKAFKS